jgi:CheY-like chemotaxis protein
LRVLCADDNADIRDALTPLIRRAGHHCEAVADGAEVLPMIAATEEAFDVVLTDHRMPRMDGLGLVKALRMMAFPGRIVVHTSAVDQRTHAAYVALGVDAILDKPASLSVLLQALGGAPVGTGTGPA